MREGWEYKKLGEVAVKISDGSHNPPKGVDYSPYPMLSSKNVFFDYYNYDDPRYLSKEAFEEENKRTDISDGDVLLTIVGTVGRTCCVKSPFISFTLQRSVAVLKPKKESIASRFLMYALHSMSELWNNEAKGVAQKGVYLKQLASIPIPVPPLSEQQRIVSELDLLSSIIEKKKAQLKEYDQLAQSIFYDMFGDPVTNEKGWEVKKLGEIGELARGVSKHRPRNAPELLGGSMPLIQTGDISNSGMYITKYNSTYSELGVSQSKIWKAGTLCVTIAANIGKCAILTFDACFPDSVVGFSYNKDYCNNELIFCLFNSLQAILEENAPAVAQKNINLKILNELKVPLPPLSLQQSFASKIESIERQKTLIQQSIAEVQTLFDSRMDYYFN